MRARLMTMLLCVAATTASAATPNPDRPSVSRTAHLVAPDTLEIELGMLWAEGRSAPATLKYSVGGVVEPRVSADLSGLDSGTPALEAGLKGRFVEEGRWALAGYAASAVPVDVDEPWYGTAQLLFTGLLGGPWSLQANGGFTFVGNGQGGARFGGVPLALAVGLAPTGKLSFFLEGASTLGEPGCDGIACTRPVVDGGVGFLLTEILIVDGGAGWDLAAEQPFAQVGLTANFGSVR